MYDFLTDLVMLYYFVNQTGKKVTIMTQIEIVYNLKDKEAWF